MKEVEEPGVLKQLSWLHLVVIYCQWTNKVVARPMATDSVQLVPGASAIVVDILKLARIANRIGATFNHSNCKHGLYRVELKRHQSAMCC